MIKRIIANIHPLSVYRELNQLRQVEFLSQKEICFIQNQRISKLLLHAYYNVPYYRNILSENNIVKKDGTVDLEKFTSIPFLTKEILRNHFEELKSSDLNKRKWYYNTSGGSTGEPVRFIQDKEYKKWVRALTILYDEWTGYKPGMPKVVLWGSERDLFVGRETIDIRLKQLIKNEVWLNSFRMTEKQMLEYVEMINKHKPIQILAYVGSIYELARFVENEGLEVFSPEAIMTSAGTLYPHMREVIERVFRSHVFNRYGSREVAGIACECEVHEGLHVSPLTHYVEIIREDGSPAAPGEVGEVVVTSLVNYAMPLIRYRIGDMAVWADWKCSCGRNWPLLKEVKGRVTDTFVTRSGIRVYGGYFTRIMYFKEWVKKFQFMQEDYDQINLLIVPAISMEKAHEQLKKEKSEMEEKIRLVMGNECKIDIELVEDIQPSPSGKHRYTISKVAENR